MSLQKIDRLDRWIEKTDKQTIIDAFSGYIGEDKAYEILEEYRADELDNAGRAL